MGIFDFLFATALVITAGGVSIPLYAMKRGYGQSDAKLRIKELEAQRKLEIVRQENFILENKAMELELDKMKKEREERERKALVSKENKRWLIEDNRSEAKHENLN